MFRRKETPMLRETRFTVLGPVRGWRGKSELELGPPQQRAMLAMLLLARGRQVSLEGLIDGLWGEQVPRTATGTVRAYASRLRGVLDPGAGRRPDRLIQSAGDGYLIQPASVLLDLSTFERRVHGARAARDRHDTAASARLLRDALGLWQGTALAGAPGPYADSQRALLTELRLAAAEEKLALEISLGEHAQATAELRALVAEQPFRERLVELLMLALYRAGRQAEALHAYEDTRRRLGDELGIDPGPALRAMHQRVLQADRRLMEAPGLRLARLGNGAEVPGAA
jgi:DNA-binding SARP family transcriptional activator